MFEAVLFDVAGVLTEGFTHALVAEAIEAGADFGLLAEALLPVFAGEGDGDSPGNRLERGEISLEEFLVGLGAAEPHARMVIDPASPHFFGHQLGAKAAMHAFVDEVRAAGCKTAAMSNNVREWQPFWDAAMPPHDRFDAVVLSCRVGLRKPNPAIYRLALAQLNVEPAAAIFLDDFAAMAQGARDVGMTAIDVVDHDEAIAEARALLGLAAPAADGRGGGDIAAAVGDRIGADGDRAAAGGAGQG